MLPTDYSPPEASIVIEAEKPSAEGEVKALIVEKVAASGGLAHCSWDTDGQWAEWEFAVPRPGTYRLLIRGASEYDYIVRAVKLDGEPLAGSLGAARFSGTGGWCRTANDWRYFVLTGADGKPLSVPLSEGTHRLRLQRIGGSMNIDCLVWEASP